MFGIGLPELIVIMALALIVIGPDKLPEMARSLAKTVMDLKKTVATLQDELTRENPLDEVKPELKKLTHELTGELKNLDRIETTAAPSGSGEDSRKKADAAPGPEKDEPTPEPTERQPEAPPSEPTDQSKTIP
jgi:sec-independent protein translocase protein TatB